MAKEKSGPGYGDVVARLQRIVDALESGELSLEASLEQFTEGIGLVKQGEQLLNDAEKRIEQLLSDDGRRAPLTIPEGAPAATPAAAAGAGAGASTAVQRPARRVTQAEDDDVPF